MTNEAISWENPPEEGKPFALYVTGQQVIFFNDIKDLRANEEKFLKDKEIVGWRPIHIDNNFPGNIPIPAPPNKD